MTKDEIDNLAEKAGISMCKLDTKHGEMTLYECSDEEMLKFVKVLIEKEREECAKVCDRFMHSTLESQSPTNNDLSNTMLRQIAILGHGETAKAIRARNT